MRCCFNYGIDYIDRHESIPVNVGAAVGGGGGGAAAACGGGGGAAAAGFASSFGAAAGLALTSPGLSLNNCWPALTVSPS